MAIGQRDASSPGAFIVINGDGLRVVVFSARALIRTDQHLGSVARAYRITSSLEVFLSSYMLVFAHLLLFQRHSTRRTTQGTRPQTSEV